ncbi:hypothetical protein JX266_002883 [Neoarthrinium moseri]|nr:hypothetical protein JX266_002883 [Neoarthrinium moseri]
MYRYFSGKPVLSDALPSYSGEYAVGTVDIEVPAEHPRRFSDAVLKETGRPAFEMETVMFSLFYPSVRGAKSAKPKHMWIPESNKLFGEGYARFAGFSNSFTNKLFESGLWTLVGSTTIPAEVDVPLEGATGTGAHSEIKEQAVMDTHQEHQFPVIVFSHGMASGRTSYTHYLAELASRGYIVAAVEHRDGSGPGSIVMRADGSSKQVFHAPRESLEPMLEVEELKTVQLALRQAEVEETVTVLRALQNGRGQEIYQANTRKEGIGLGDWHGRLDIERFIMAGHSYGATLAMQALKDAPNDARPFVAGIALDPGKSSGRLNDDIDVPLLVIHSQSWSAKHSIFYDRTHFDTVKSAVQDIITKRKKAAWFITAEGTTHPTVTDAPLIEPTLLSWTTGATVGAKEGIMHYVDASRDFLSYMMDGQKRGILEEPVSHPEYNNQIRPLPKEFSKIWQVHVSPAS